MKKFDGWVLFSDVDGTISTWDFIIPEENLNALKYFTDNGGKFSVATGRGKSGITSLTCYSYINFPCVLTNGTTVYDTIQDKVIFMEPLPQKARDMLISIRNSRPDLRLMVWGEEDRFDVGARVDLPFEPNFSSIEELDAIWTKVVIAVEPQERINMIQLLNTLAENQVDITSSGASFVEIMPKGISKGSTTEKLIKLYKLDRSRVCAIGDFYNDLEMLSLPGINSFCPANAEEDIKAIAKKTLCSVDNGAVAQLIYSL